MKSMRRILDEVEDVFGNKWMSRISVVPDPLKAGRRGRGHAPRRITFSATISMMSDPLKPW